MVFAITQMMGLIALVSLIPFIILYMRRPRPKDETIPSLMFLMQQNERSKRYSFWQRFTSNILFFLQLLTLLALSLAIAIPTITLPYDVTKENTIIILDASASMQAKDAQDTRFERALDEAKSALSGRNTIILAENNPLIVLEEESTDLAQQVLAKITPRATSTNLGDALLLAKDILGEKPGRIVVISDFLLTEGPDVAVSRSLLQSEGKAVDFIDVSKKAENVGLIKIEVGKFESKAYIKNFDLTEKKRTVEIRKDGKTLAQTQLTIAPLSVENFLFQTPPGVSTVEISPRDALEVDDVSYVSAPDKSQMNVLLVTNVDEGNRALRSLELALTAAPDVALTVAHPPVITIARDGQKIDPYKQDIIIFYRVNRESILPGTFGDIEDFVEKGGSFIMAAQPDLARIDMGKMDLIDAKTVSQTPAKVCVNTINTVTQPFEKESCFTTVSQYLEGELEGKSVVFFSAGTSPLFAYREHGAGNIAYYGIMDEFSDFRNLPSYPIFWNTLLNFMAGTEDIRSFNFQTGSVLTVDSQEVRTPSQIVSASKVLLDEQGIYEFGNRKIAANLHNEKESAISQDSSKSQASQRNELLGSSIQDYHDFSLVFVLSLLAFILIFTELIIIKVRGDV